MTISSSNIPDFRIENVQSTFFKAEDQKPYQENGLNTNLMRLPIVKTKNDVDEDDDIICLSDNPTSIQPTITTSNPHIYSILNQIPQNSKFLLINMIYLNIFESF